MENKENLHAIVDEKEEIFIIINTHTPMDGPLLLVWPVLGEGKKTHL